MKHDATCRVMLDAKPNRGSWNMALDEHLLETAVSEDCCSVRVYEWSTPTVSLGYFQGEPNQRFANLPHVRRLSGGGALLHHHELTYSCAIPASWPITKTPPAIYDEVHSAIVAMLDRRGVRAQVRGDVPSDEDSKLFMCFGRMDSHDVICHRHKIVGSAQRRRRGAVLQHGSLLLRASELATEFPGIHELCQGFYQDNLADDLASSIAAQIAVSHQLSNEVDLTAVNNLEAARYGRDEWTMYAAKIRRLSQTNT